MIINFTDLVLYKLNTHDDIHLKVGNKISDIIDYAPETYYSIFINTLNNSNNKTLKNICKLLPFNEDINNLIYEEELKAEIYNSFINIDLLPLKETDTLNCPIYFNESEIHLILRTHNINFTGNIIYNNVDFKVDNIFNLYSFEKYYFGQSVDELRPLRELSNNIYKDSELNFYYNIGNSIIAPIYTFFTEWLIKFCNKHNITTLLPLMREATLFNNCFNLILDNQFNYKPLYCSRRFLFNASINDDNFESKISQTIIKSKSSPEILCNDLGLDGSQFKLYNTVRDLRINNKFEEFKQYFYNNKDNIINYSTNQRELFCKTLLDLINNSIATTVDIGFSGTSEGLIRDILRMQKIDINLYHCIIMGSDSAQIKNIQSGLNIYSWLGLAGENTEYTKRLMYQIQTIEPLLNDICGTTLTYDNNGPVLDTIIPNNLDYNFSRAQACQQGVLYFVQNWIKYKKEYSDIKSIINNKLGFINIWRRLLETPTYEEANYIGNLLLYDNYTKDKTTYKVKGEITSSIENPDLYLENISRVKSDFPQANIVLQYPQYFNNKLISKMLTIPGINRILEIIMNLLNNSNKNIAIFAAGQRGQDFLKVAKLYNININCFIDSNINIQGTTINGLIVKDITEATNIDIFINASYNYSEQVTQIILDHYKNNNPLIYTFE